MSEQSEQSSNPDELAFLDRRETDLTDPETDTVAQELKQFIGGLDSRLATAPEVIPTGKVEGFNKYDGPKEERVHDLVENPGAVRVKSWHNEEEGTDVTKLLFGPEAVETPHIADGAVYLTYTKDVAGELVGVDSSIMYPSQFRSSFGEHAHWEAGKGISGSHQGGRDGGPMSPEEAQQTLSGVLVKFDELLGEAGL